MRYITKRELPSVEQHKINCKLGKGSIIWYPTEGPTRQYTQFSFQVKSPFIIVADLEASNAANASIPSTPTQHIKTIHRINYVRILLAYRSRPTRLPIRGFQGTNLLVTRRR